MRMNCEEQVAGQLAGIAETATSREESSWQDS
jgi:hypothetical protein